MQKGKRGAIELSIGTIVIVVLAMSMLILGLVLIKAIFTGATNAVDMSNAQITSKIGEIYGADLKVGVYPSSKQIDVIQGKVSGFGVGIKNNREGSASNDLFSYEIVVADTNVQTKCSASAEDMAKLITTGQAEEGIQIASGDTYSTKVVFSTQTGDPLCTVRFRVTAKVNGQVYGSPQAMDVTFKAP